ncbi:hypothetical protein [Mucilaginibacter sp. L3T2-6]|uniref:DUF6992 family protein n=1 Tax=Mucilaginibacter sp. L3T2-6 TaxID=3062491 RepID=UPI0026753004|nr:hypothetical protein [Mucilaginibacter sp. L3T2-6]MDO3643323.1 hypothetical protein [Mucilaginibacter sp. L3T2-6]MDV6215744.1 hypothetical protein [Mucilaginibacter sp. L3T2-6]
MKNRLTVILLFISLIARGQDSLKYFNSMRYQITKTGMTVLGSWAIANIGVGAAGWGGSKGGQNKYFYQMTTFWGAANLGAAILGYTGNKNKQLSAPETLKAQRKIQKIFLINGGLDLAYIGAGIYLNHRGITHGSAQLKGYGTALLPQGLFLLLFDGTMYATHRSNGNKLRRFFEKNPISFNGREIGMSISLSN